MAYVNTSDQWLMLDADGAVVEGRDNPAARTVLCAPGGQLDEADARRYELHERLTPLSEIVQVDAVGDEVVLRGVRAVAASAVASRPRNQVVAPIAVATTREARDKGRAPKGEPQAGKQQADRDAGKPAGNVAEAGNAPANAPANPGSGNAPGGAKQADAGKGK